MHNPPTPKIKPKLEFSNIGNSPLYSLVKSLQDLITRGIDILLKNLGTLIYQQNRII